MEEYEKINFIRQLDISGTNIATGARLAIDLSSLYKNFGKNFNTLSIINTTTGEPCSLWLDGFQVIYLPENISAQFDFDWEDGITFSMVEIKNEDGADVLASGSIKLMIGRTGFKK